MFNSMNIFYHQPIMFNGSNPNIQSKASWSHADVSLFGLNSVSNCITSILHTPFARHKSPGKAWTCAVKHCQDALRSFKKRASFIGANRRKFSKSKVLEENKK